MSSKTLSSRDAAHFFRQLSVMLTAGIPLLTALDSLHHGGNRVIKRPLGGIISSLEQGQSLADALVSCGLFTETTVSMVRAGELGGKLDLVLSDLATYLERKQATVQKLKSALMYPAIVVLILLVTLVVLFTLILPLFEDAFQELGNGVPPTTATLFLTSRFVSNHLMEIALVTGGMTVILAWSALSSRGRKLIDPVTVRLPLIGGLVRQAALARFCRTLSSLVIAGVPILQGLEMAARCSGNTVLLAEVGVALERIRAGSSLAQSLTGCVMFPPPVVQIIAVGEKSGALGTCLQKASDLYDDDNQYTVDRLTRLLEPALIIGLGTFIGFIVLSVLIPMFDMLDVIGVEGVGR